MTFRFTTHKWTIFAATAIALSACSGSNPSEPLALATEKLVDRQTFSLSSAIFGSIVNNKIVPSHCRLEVVGGSVVFTESPELAQLQYPDDSDPAHHLKTFALGTLPAKFPDPFSDGTAELTALNLFGDDVVASISDTSADLEVKLSGNVHVRSPWDVPDFDVVLDAVTLTISLGTGPDPASPYGTNLGVQNLVVNVAHHVDGCGPLPWCSAVLDALLPDLGAMLHDLMLPKLKQELAQPEAKAALTLFLDGVSDALAPAQNGESHWALDLASGVTINNGAIHWQASRVAAPLMPQNCRGDALCTGAVSFTCDPQPESFILERFVPWTGSVGLIGVVNGAWIIVGRDDDTARGISPSLGDAAPARNAAVTYHVCTTNVAAKVCTPAYTVVTTPSICLPAGAGGGITVCGRGLRMCNGRCIIGPCIRVE